MNSIRNLSSPLLALVVGALALGVSACSGTTQFASAQPIQIAGTPPPPPPAPAPVAKAEEPPKPPPRVELRDNKIEFKEKIQFEVNKAVIKPESFSLLHDIAEVIKKNPQVKRLSIEGHASAEGDAKKNKALSDERAKSVVEHLVKKEAVEAARLGAKGWGVEKPIAGNDTEDGREKNRRVEFLVVEQDVTKTHVEIDPATGKEKIVGEKKETVTHPDHATPADQAAKPAPGADAKKLAPGATDPAKAGVKKADPKADAKAADPKKADPAKKEGTK